MASKEAVKVPTIDFCKKDLRQGCEEWESTKTQVFKTLQEYGCFEAIYDKVSDETRKGIFDTLEQILPLGTKLKEYMGKPYHHKYEGQLPHIPLIYENLMHAADLILPQSVDTFANTFWPSGNSTFCNLVKSYYEPLVELDKMVKMMVLESLGMKNDMFNIPNAFQLRFTEYFKGGRFEDGREFEFPAHTDASFLTIVKQKQAGLQLLTKNGEWIEPTVSPNSYLVLSSDSFMAWTNGRIPSATHKVTIKADSDRFSIQLFSLPEPGHIVEAPKGLADEEHPLLFKPFDIVRYYEYLTSGAKAGVSLKAYSSI